MPAHPTALPGTLAPDPVRVVQVRDRSGIIDLAWGHPDMGLLPADALGAAAATALATYVADALAYGRDSGPPPFVAFVRERLAATDARTPGAEEIVVTAGASHALDLVVTLLTKPGDVVLVEEPTLVNTGWNYIIDANGVKSPTHAFARLQNGSVVYYGAETTRDAVRAQVGLTGTIGSFYLSSAGKAYLKVANANATADWERVTTSAAD